MTLVNKITNKTQFFMFYYSKINLIKFCKDKAIEG